MESGSGKHVQSNEEIIDELTRGLEESAIMEKHPDKGESEGDGDGEKNDKKTSSEDPWSSIGKDEDDSTLEEKKNENPDDFVDEEALKDREIDLSEEQKEVRGSPFFFS